MKPIPCIPGIMMLCTVLLSGCSSLLAPDYRRPDTPVPRLWPGMPPSSSSAPAADIGWRELIRDDRLQRLVEMALANNRDLRIAALNMEKARAQYGISRAGLFPAISASAAGTHSQSAADLTDGESPRISHNDSAGVGFSRYELDVFGKIQNQKDQAQEDWLQLGETRSALQISLIAEVVNGYLRWAADRERLQLSQATADSQLESHHLIERRHAYGIASRLDVSAAQVAYDAARVEVASDRARVAQDENALALLLGAPVPADLMPPIGVLASDSVLQAVPAGVSSSVLLRRPDLRADEHALKSANASIGAARAAFFPSISLTAELGSASSDLRRLFRGGNGSWSFVPQINLPLFNGGALMAALTVAKTTRDISVATYERDIQVAFREVSDALAERGAVADQLRSQQSRVDAEARSVRLAGVRYRSGIDGYLSLLAARRSLYTAQQSLIDTRLAVQVNRATLFKALGGGAHE